MKAIRTGTRCGHDTVTESARAMDALSRLFGQHRSDCINSTSVSYAPDNTQSGSLTSDVGCLTPCVARRPDE